MKASEFIHQKVANIINQIENPDGSVTIRIYKQGWKKAYSYRVKKLNKPDMEILEDEEITETIK